MQRSCIVDVPSTEGLGLGFDDHTHIGSSLETQPVPAAATDMHKLLPACVRVAWPPAWAGELLNSCEARNRICVPSSHSDAHSTSA